LPLFNVWSFILHFFLKGDSLFGNFGPPGSYFKLILLSVFAGPESWHSPPTTFNLLLSLSKSRASGAHLPHFQKPPFSLGSYPPGANAPFARTFTLSFCFRFALEAGPGSIEAFCNLWGPHGSDKLLPCFRFLFSSSSRDFCMPFVLVLSSGIHSSGFFFFFPFFLSLKNLPGNPSQFPFLVDSSPSFFRESLPPLFCVSLKNWMGSTSFQLRRFGLALLFCRGGSGFPFRRFEAANVFFPPSPLPGEFPDTLFQ